MHRGSCLCGAVRFSVAGDLAGATACHCSQCRRQSGHYWASAVARLADFAVTDGGSLRWYAASAKAKRGFCSSCGTFLFWQHLGEDSLSVSMAAFDTPTGLTLNRHIFVADKGDYYDIEDNLPQRAD